MYLHFHELNKDFSAVKAKIVISYTSHIFQYVLANVCFFFFAKFASAKYVSVGFNT